MFPAIPVIRLVLWHRHRRFDLEIPRALAREVTATVKLVQTFGIPKA